MALLATSARFSARPCNTPSMLGGCASTQYGCCADGVTPAWSATSMCKQTVLGGCAGTEWGCCPDGVTPRSSTNDWCAYDPPAEPVFVGGCAGTLAGCCLDGSQAKTPDDPCKKPCQPFTTALNNDFSAAALNGACCAGKDLCCDGAQPGSFFSHLAVPQVVRDQAAAFCASAVGGPASG